MPARILAALVAVLFSLASPVQAASNNILVIIADDMGIDVTSFYRTTVRVQTTPAPPTLPNLRDLAAGGVTFTRMWATPWCSPTRASIITGRYGFRHGLGVPIDQSGTPAVILPTSETILPEIVKDSSRAYQMRHVGKWHLSEGTNDPYTYGWPTWTGPNPGAGGPASSGTGSPNYNSWRKYTGGSGGSTNATTTVYATTDQVNEAVATINAANTAGKPYFIWLAFNAPHYPYHKPPNALHSRDGLPATGGDIRDYYEAMIEAMDTEIGRLLASVNLATTTVIFLGDNGTPENIPIAPYAATDRSKGSVYDGGMHVPFIVAGQAVASPGRYVTALANCVDIFPTILELAGINPATVTPSVKRDGVSLMPYLQNKAHPNPRRWAYGETFPTDWNASWQRAIRNVDFVLIERQTGTTREFYNLTTDPLQADNILGRTRTAYEQANLDELDAELDALLATR